MMTVLHRPLAVDRISMLVVAEDKRGRGIGRMLVAAAENRLRSEGFGLVEVTSNVAREPSTYSTPASATRGAAIASFAR